MGRQKLSLDDPIIILYRAKNKLKKIKIENKTIDTLIKENFSEIKPEYEILKVGIGETFDSFYET